MMKFEWWSLRHVDSLVMAITHCCPALLSDDSTRVVLQAQEDYINASHIMVRITDMTFCILSLLHI